MICLILLLVRHVFRGDEYLVVFSDRHGIDTESAGGAQVGMVCRASVG